jgi:hypothetical protein
VTILFESVPKWVTPMDLLSPFNIQTRHSETGDDGGASNEPDRMTLPRGELMHQPVCGRST